ncbi:MAG: hypothetical protein M3320_10070 [Actinomycetota bacterium]|nr:hypothetical protein [Actinomycetota bacterium]MDQ5809011.1 hypothetical protein [Actinomycetota bacterium]
MSDEKLTESLRARIAEQQGEELLDVVVELEQDAAAQTSMPEAQRSFSARAEPVESAIAEAGGEVVDAAWINSTLRARVPAKKLRDVTSVDHVTAVDLPRAIEPD